VHITVLTIPDCPNVPVILSRIATALAGRAASLELVEVTDQDQAARWGMTGSPTILLDGADPFAVPGTSPSISCRLYPGTDGRVEGAPSTPDLRQAFQAAGLPPASPAKPTP